VTVETSAELRARIRPADGSPTLISFSRGKDAIAALLALRESGHAVACFHLELPPGLDFVRESCERLERALDIPPILLLPHPALYAHVRAHVFHPPWFLDTAEASMIWPLRWTYDHCREMARAHFHVPPDRWIATGVRSADSPNRRAAFLKTGGTHDRHRQAHPIWDWTVDDVERIIRRHGVKLPIDYRIWGRTFDGIDARFTEPLRRHFPRDFDRLVDWYPMLDLDLFRNGTP